MIVPLPEGLSRVESGVMQFGPDDWPGVFIRGDHALAYAAHLRMLARACTDPINASVVKNLALLLESCRIPVAADPGLEVGGTQHGRASDA